MVDFWSKRRAKVDAEERALRKAQTREIESPSTEPDLSEKSETEILEELGLPDPDSLKPGDDFRAFMQKQVPEFLRRRALRKLWTSNPVLANLDGLVDHGEDFTDAATVKAGMKTSYEVGKGLREHVMALARQAEKDEAPEESPTEITDSDEISEEIIEEPPIADADEIASIPQQNINHAKISASAELAEMPVIVATSQDVRPTVQHMQFIFEEGEE